MNCQEKTKTWVKKTVTHLENYVLQKEYQYDENIDCYYEYNTTDGGKNNEIE